MRLKIAHMPESLWLFVRSVVDSVRVLLIWFLIIQGAYAEPANAPSGTATFVRAVEAPVADASIKAVLIGPFADSIAAGLWQIIVSRIPESADRKWFSAASDVPRDSVVRYPSLSRPAAFLCVKSRCSVPLFTVAELNARIDDMVEMRGNEHEGDR